MTSSMRVLCTGGAGFIGSHVVDLLVKNKIDTYVLISGFRSKKHPNFVNEDAYVIGGNLLDEGSLISVTKNMDFVLHFGAVSSHYCEAYPNLAFDVNIKGTWNLKKACSENNVKRIIFASTSFIYDDSETSSLTEQAPLNPKGNYEVSKLSAEKVLQATYPVQVPYTILRLFNVYGPRSYPDGLYSQVITTYILAALRKDSLEIHDTGKQELDFIYVKDVAQAFCQSLDGKAENQIFNVGSGESTSINKLAATINELAENPTPSHYNTKHIAYLKHAQADISKIKNVLGWIPQYSLREGLEDTVKFFKEELD